ncbi:uncharacterized protein ACB057_009245 [Neosynchiropus ocellatus]
MLLILFWFHSIRGFKGRSRGGRMSRGVMHGGRGMMMKGFGPPGPGMSPDMDGFMNGFVPPMSHHHHPRLPPPMHMRGGPFPPMPRPGLPPPLPPPFRGHPGFRGPPPHPRGRGMPPPGPPRHFHPMGPRGFNLVALIRVYPRLAQAKNPMCDFILLHSYHNGPVTPPPHPPLGRGQRWPGPPGGRRF